VQELFGTYLAQGANQVGGPIDLDALITYIQGLSQPLTAVIDGRLTRLN
jgi:5'-nucleotidase